ncbi:hypothetical protein ACFX2G_013532 [Malus domestica]
MLFEGNLPTDKEIGNPHGAEPILNPPSCPSFPHVSKGMQGPVMRLTPLPVSSEVSLKGPNLYGTEQLIHCIRLNAAMDAKSHIEERISKCPWEDLALLKEDLSKLVSVIDNLNVDSSPLKVQIAELMATSIEYYSLHVISSKKLSLDVRAQQLAAMDLSIAQVWFSQQAVSEDYQVTRTSLASVKVRLEELERERGQLGIEASQLEGVLSKQEATISQYQKEMSCLEQEKGMAMKLPTLSLTDVETLKTLEGLLEDRFRSFRDIVL